MDNWHDVEIAEFPIRHCRGKGEDPGSVLVVGQGGRKWDGKKASVVVVGGGGLFLVCYTREGKEISLTNNGL